MGGSGTILSSGVVTFLFAYIMLGAFCFGMLPHPLNLAVSGIIVGLAVAILALRRAQVRRGRLVERAL